jgi:hypothetical protein
MPACPSDKGRLVARKSGGGKSRRQGDGKLIEYAAEERSLGAVGLNFEFARLHCDEILLTLGVAVLRLGGNLEGLY